MKSFLLKAITHNDCAFLKIKRDLEHELEDFWRIISQSPFETVNQIEIRIAGLRRTGNHAIITWIRSQFKNKQSLHLNNLIVNENPYRYKYEHLRDYYPEHKVVIERYRQQAKGNFVPRQCLIYSYEDYSLRQIFNNRFEKKHDLYLGLSAKRYDVLIIRDPFNLFASRFKNNFREVKISGKTDIELWIEYAKEYLEETNYLKHNKLCINYNQWFQDRSYRQNLLDRLGIYCLNPGLSQVGNWGGGSSFDGTEFQGQAEKMDLLGRWKHFVDDPEYRNLFKNKQLIAYSEKIFGEIPETEIFK